MGSRSKHCDSVGPGKGSEVYIFNEHPTVDCTLRNTEIFYSEDPFQYLHSTNLFFLRQAILGTLTFARGLPALGDEAVPTGRACLHLCRTGSPGKAIESTGLLSLCWEETLTSLSLMPR